MNSVDPVENYKNQTTAGNYFVSNYPPYSFWKTNRISEAFDALEKQSAVDTPLGIYLHIPFCRKRCHFCYFKVYTNNDAAMLENYISSMITEMTLYSKKTSITGRTPKFVYFGGGTPSYLSSRQLISLTEALKDKVSWDDADEITFECEPGTPTENKLDGIRNIGVTRLSLGVENFNDELLKGNGRAHGSKEIDKAYRLARLIGFPQVNIDLIAGMVGETNENWKKCIEKTIDLEPDSVTIYQMEIPFNTTVFQEMKVAGQEVAPVADWQTKRRWVNEAFERLEASGYTITSAYTAVKNPAETRFLYRDFLWTGADLIGLGVASFSHVGGTNYQNQQELSEYKDSLSAGRLPIYRALTPSIEERLIRELILQLKLGEVQPSYFLKKFKIDVNKRFSNALSYLQSQNYIDVGNDNWSLRREGLLQVDNLLAEFFLEKHQNSRYT